MKFSRVFKLRAKSKAGGSKTKPLIVPKFLGAEITSKPILAHQQIYATNRERRARRQRRNASHLQQAPLFPSLVGSPTGPTSSLDTNSVNAGVQTKTPLRHGQQRYPQRSLQYAQGPTLTKRSPRDVRLRKNRGKRSQSSQGYVRRVKRARYPPGVNGTMEDLHSMLRLGGDSQHVFPLYTLLAVDTESRMTPWGKVISEIGLTTLRVGDVVGLEPGQYARNWEQKMEHCHIHVQRVGVRRPPKAAMFAKTQTLSTTSTRAMLKNFMMSLYQEHEGRVAIVGHSVMSDVFAILQDPALQIDLRTIGGRLVNVDKIFDTVELGIDAVIHGAEFGSLRLGNMMADVGADPKYLRENTAIGCHNASNDAVYSMMALILLATRWKELTTGSPVEKNLEAARNERNAAVQSLMAELAAWRDESKFRKRGAESVAPATKALDDTSGVNGDRTYAREDGMDEDAQPLGFFSRLYGYFRKAA